MPNPSSRAEIRISHLRHNYRELRQRAAAGLKSLCVVKANAYGHGAVAVARALSEENVDVFGVATVDEGIQIRTAGITQPLLVMVGRIAGQFEELVEHELTPVLYRLDVAYELDQYLGRIGKSLEVHVKVDTGMTRLGILPEEAPHFFKKLQSFQNLIPVGLMTHFAEAGDPPFTAEQRRRFRQVVDHVRQSAGERSLILHVANSIATVTDQNAGTDWVRLGIMLYGSYPLEALRSTIALKPVMRWVSALLSLKKVPAGTPVGYNRTFTTQRESLLGVVPVGYADGYNRLLSNRAQMLIRGRRVPVIGNVCMDMTMVDLTDLPDVELDDEVVLLGEQEKECITGDEMADWAQTIAYEIFCRVAERVPRVVVP